MVVDGAGTVTPIADIGRRRSFPVHEVRSLRAWPFGPPCLIITLAGGKRRYVLGPITRLDELVARLTEGGRVVCKRRGWGWGQLSTRLQ